MTGRPILPEERALALARVLEVLANPLRLQLLSELRAPRALSELRVGRAGEDFSLLSRQAVWKHLVQMEEAGLVVRREGRREGKPADEFVVDHRALFMLSETMRELASLRPLVEPEAPTRDGSAEAAPAGWPGRGPHLVLVHGVDAGAAFELTPATSADGRSWTLGRRKTCAVPLDYDPWVSSEHALVERRAGAWWLRDLPTNQNGTLLNGAPVERGGVAPLRHGDVVQAGLSVLVFRDP